jgi:D-3-phosphoglycerate dehydrogenase
MQVYDFDVEIGPAEHMVFFTYQDVPGVIGTVGTILGQHGVNIATMEVGRRSEGGEALMGLTVDGPIPPHVLEDIGATIGANRLRSITLPF